MNVDVIWLANMRLKLNIKHLLAAMLLVCFGVFLHLRLGNAISTLEHDIGNVDSTLHTVAKQKLTKEFSAMMASASDMSVDKVILDSNPTTIEYCLFRRTIQCRYNLNIGYTRREIAHSRIPRDERVDENYVDVPSKHHAKQSVCIIATPFGYRMKNP